MARHRVDVSELDRLSQANSEELHCFLHNQREVKGR